MNNNFVNGCYNLAALSTCVVDNQEWTTSATKQMAITPHLMAVAKYHYLPGEELALYDYEIHSFSIDFFRKGIWLDDFSYQKEVHPDKYGSLADPDIDLETKMKALSDLRPGIKNSLKAFFTKSNLTPEEQAVVIAKSSEIAKAALEMQENTSRGV